MSLNVDIMANKMDAFQKFYLELTEVLPMIINSLVTRLYSDKLLSGNHKDCMDSLATGKEKTEYFLDKVIKPGLAIKYTKLFDEMLRVMESNDDPTVNYLVMRSKSHPLFHQLIKHWLRGVKVTIVVLHNS